MITEALVVPTEMAEIFNADDWETISFKVHTKTYHAPKYRFSYAKMCPGKENPVLVALNQMPSSTQYPIKVDESITESDFETLLSLLYPTGLGYVDTPLKDLWTKDQWASILKISSLWFYQDLRALALRFLDGDSLSTIDMIALGRAYSVPEWVTEGLCALCHSHSLIDASLFDTLGHLTALRIYQIRERKEFPEARSNEDNGTFPSEYQGVEEDVIRVFWDELEGLAKGFEEHGIPRLSRPPRAHSAPQTPFASVPDTPITNWSPLVFPNETTSFTATSKPIASSEAGDSILPEAISVPLPLAPLDRIVSPLPGPRTKVDTLTSSLTPAFASPMSASPAAAIPASSAPATPASPAPALPSPAMPAPAMPAPAMPAPASPAPAMPATPASPAPAMPASPAPAMPATPASPAPVSPTPALPVPSTPARAMPAPASLSPGMFAPPAPYATHSSVRPFGQTSAVTSSSKLDDPTPIQPATTNEPSVLQAAHISSPEPASVMPPSFDTSPGCIDSPPMTVKPEPEHGFETKTLATTSVPQDDNEWDAKKGKKKKSHLHANELLKESEVTVATDGSEEAPMKKKGKGSTKSPKRPREKKTKKEKRSANDLPEGEPMVIAP